MTQTEFTLFAPYNAEAALLGDFSDWQALPMQKGQDGVFRVSVDLEDGEYQYKFRVASESYFVARGTLLELADPYATRVTDDEHQNTVTTVRGGQHVLDDYVWQHDDAPLPPDDALVVYELHVGDFSGGEANAEGRGTYQDVLDKLDYLTDLGVNAVELMPVEQYPGSYSWGYNVRYYFSAEPHYGPSEDLKRFIDACHARGIRVLLDMVFNHSEADSPLTQINFDYWYLREPKDPNNSWGPEFDYVKYDSELNLFPARKFIGDVVRFWVEHYHVDGIRFDAAKPLGNYDALRTFVAVAKETAGAKPFYTVAEYLPETPSITGPDGPTDACWHDGFMWTLVDLLTGRSRDLERLKTVLDGKRQGFPGTSNLVNYLSNHDHDHLMGQLGDAGMFGDEAFRRLKLGVALQMTALGVPLVWMGEEFGEYQHKVQSADKLEWTLLANDNNRDLLETYRGLIHLRTQNAALHTANIDFFHENAPSGVLAYVRWNDEGSRVVVVANVSSDYLGGYAVPNFPADGRWHEWTRDYDVNAQNGTLTLDLPPLEAKVFVYGGS